MKSAGAFLSCTECICNIEKYKADYYRQPFHHLIVKACDSITSFTNIGKTPGTFPYLDKQFIPLASAVIYWSSGAVGIWTYLAITITIVSIQLSVTSDFATGFVWQRQYESGKIRPIYVDFYRYERVTHGPSLPEP